MKAVVLAVIILSGCGMKRVLPIPPGLVEAPTGFDLKTNGFESQKDMDNDRAQFEQDAGPGVLGPFFNGRSCLNCHSNPVTGGQSPVFEHRVGPDDPMDQIASGTLIHDQSIDPNQQQRAPADAVNALRATLSLFGDGLVEQIPPSVFTTLSANGGQYLMVPVLEKPGVMAIGRFGWKDQHASLLSFAADAAFNEMGEGNRLVPDPANGIEDNDNPTPGRPEDIDNYAGFMRSLKAPARGPITPQVTHGQALFEHIGCAVCHVPTLYTDGTVQWPPYKFHPFGDYLLHDIGTGDGIMQAGAPPNKVRTAPLWGLRIRARLLHDGRAFDLPTAIQDHRNDALASAQRFRRLSNRDKTDVLAFLLSL
jgi:CxxC motif-containing protein (DUF1111 family)/predicted small lipoprotein YifL